MVIKIDRRAVYFLLGVLLLAVPLGAGLWLGQTNIKPSAQPAAQQPAAQPGAANAGAGAAAAPPAAQPADTTPPAADPALAAVPRISVDDAKKLLGKPDVVFIDARFPDQFAQGHLKGAINISEADAAAKSADLPKDKDIILYCT